MPLKMSFVEQVAKNGYAIIEDFLTEAQINDLKMAGHDFCKKAAKDGKKGVFSADGSEQQASDSYFLESADKIRFFYETIAMDENGDFTVNPEMALNKVGHGLHISHPIFANVTFHEKIKDICRKMKLKKPAVVQSMYIFKNPKIGGEVNPHQDSSYLYTEPLSLYGFWFALDDATEENGCLWFIPGSHKNNEMSYRLIRNPDERSKKLCIGRGEYPPYEETDFVITPVKRGTCVIIHGSVIHRSLRNYSNKCRHAYTFHVYDSATSKYSEENWLQADFIPLY